VNERLAAYLLDVTEGRRTGLGARVVRALLGGLSKLYGLVVRARAGLFRLGVLRRHRLGCLVISVGNITLGGTGKTPVVEMLAAALRDAGRKVAVLSRGYKGRTSLWRRVFGRRIAYKPRIVSDGREVLLLSREAGDEPVMLARNLPGVVVLADANRVKAGLYAIDKFGVDTLVLDDGFQYLRLARTFDFVLIDCTNPFGNGRLLPRGVLREPLGHLRRAAFFMLTKSDGADVASIRETLRALNPAADVIETTHEPLHLQETFNGSRRPLEALRGQRVVALSAIANPRSFEQALAALGADVVRSHRYMDHHRFSALEVAQVIEEAREQGAAFIVTTEKDAVRLPPLDVRSVPIVFLRVNIRIVRGATDFNDCVARLCYV
jgi:tetraacyldisaccharide 4'-kinase